MNKETLCLSGHVKKALASYLDHLEGEDPVDLYAIVLESMEKPLLKTVMDYVEYNQSRAAKALGLHRNTLRKKLSQHKLDKLV